MMAWIRWRFPYLPPAHTVVAVILASVIPIAVVEVLVYRVDLDPATGLRPEYRIHLRRSVVKILGLLATLALIGLVFWALPEYGGSLYATFWSVCRGVAPIGLLLAIPYFIYVDGRQKDPCDGYWHMGMLCLLKTEQVNFSELGVYWRAWAVKAFFLPVMIGFLAENIDWLFNTDYSRISDFTQAYDVAFHFLIFLDVCFAAGGYAMTYRLLNAHIRSTDPSWPGWISAISCYPPFWTAVFAASYLRYDDGRYWSYWLQDLPALKILWGTSILLLMLVYACATISLGYRFSNLTYRGLVTNGFYRFTKHPAYVAKNVSWWMISMPFLTSMEWQLAARNCLLLLFVNGIYYVRARTEENHLSRWPEYVAYAEAMNARSIFAPLGKLVPVLRYRSPAVREDPL